VKAQLASRSQSTCFTHGTFSCLFFVKKASFATALSLTTGFFD
jgi:hypothetical protein